MGNFKIIFLLILLFSNITIMSVGLSGLLAASAFLLLIYLKARFKTIIKKMTIPLIASFIILAAKGAEFALVIISGSLLVISFSFSFSEEELLNVFKNLKFPPVLVEITLLMYRYVFVLKEEAVRMRDAQRVRLGYLNPTMGLKSIASLIGKLFIKSYDRSISVSEAMTLRGKHKA